MKVVLTGSSSGFGWLTAQTLAKQGHTVYATMRDVSTRNADAATKIRNWAIENQADIKVVELNVTSDSSVEKAIKEIAEDAAGQIDVVINNAGLFIVGLSESLSNKQVDHIFQINVIGSDRVIKAILPYMRKQKSGLLIQLSSGLSRVHLPYLGAYSAAKAAIDTLAETYHYELSPLGIDSVIVQPGAYPTTELFNKQIRPENVAIEADYGDYPAKIKQGLGYMTAPTPENSNAQEVADLIAKIIDTPNGQRKIWYPIGLGQEGQMVAEQINNGTHQFSVGLQNALGMSN